ncbi:carboxymuconolactone decarboxylase family protein [uncultured Flavobacterium sp.]|uniref:carboxymuconolactone decarboxylase family protein n=1 Tax=uncultured Flavobacterium sp. TaxID=165435 RepID=UPI0030816AFD
MKSIKYLLIITIQFAFITSLSAQTSMKSDQSLTQKEQSIVPIAAFTAKGETQQLRVSLNSGLDAGLSINEIKEIMVQIYAYAGFPRTLNALSTFITVLDERKKNGIHDEIGKDASPVATNENKLKKGTALQTKLLGKEMKTSTADFAPIIDIFLKEHLFADIFSRDILDFKTREIVTIATLASLGNAETQLRSHINVGIYNGITETQLNDIANILKNKVGPAERNSMKEILKNIYMKNNETIKSNQNPYTLVYDGAITENVKGKVNINPVSYKIKDITIVANVYTPPNYNAANKYPAIVIAHPNGGVKEQVAGLYAQHLAEQGYITITADAAYQGGSGGYPRNVDKPANRIEDIYSMADFISQYAGVDASRLGLLGICGGGGYSLKAAQSDKRFKVVATLSMFNSGLVRRNGYMNSQLSTIQERLKQASDARAQEAAGGEILYANNSSTPMTKEQIAKIPVDLYRQGIEYYTITYSHPNSSAKYTLSSLLDLMTWDASTNMDLIEQPLLMIAGSKADSYYMTEDAFAKATNSKNKELFLIEGATHIETYWKPEYVNQAVTKLSQFYAKFL